MIEHIKKNVVGYLIPLCFTVCWIAFLAVMDARHEAKGIAAEVTIESELRTVRRDKRSLKNYIDQAPSETYDAARQATLRELEDEEKELQESLTKLRKSE